MPDIHISISTLSILSSAQLHNCVVLTLPGTHVIYFICLALLTVFTYLMLIYLPETHLTFISLSNFMIP